MTKETESNLYFSAAEVARRLGLKANTLAAWRRRATPGSPPFLKLCGTVRYRAADITAWLAENEHR